MKTLALAIIMTVSLNTFASSSVKGGEEKEKSVLLEQITKLIGDQQVIEALGLNGDAQVSFVIDQNDVIHVESVEANDFLSEFHIRQALEGVKMEVSDSLVGKTFSTIVKFVQSK